LIRSDVQFIVIDTQAGLFLQSNSWSIFPSEVLHRKSIMVVNVVR